MSIAHYSPLAESRHNSVFNPRTSCEYTQGYAAYFAGCALSGNPYLSADPNVKARRRAKNWHIGWCDAEHDAADCPLVDIGCANIAIAEDFDDE